MRSKSESRATNATLMRRWRKAAGYSTAQAGERFGLSGRAIEDIEQGRRRVDDEVLRIALESLIKGSR